MTGQDIILENLLLEKEMLKKLAKSAKKNAKAIVAGSLIGTAAAAALSSTIKPQEPRIYYRGPEDFQKTEKALPDVRLKNASQEKPEKKTTDIESLINKYRGKITFHFMNSLIHAESRYRPNIDSIKGAKYGRGLCQISEVLLNDYNRIMKKDIKPQELYKPEINIKIACWYLNRLYGTIKKPHDLYIAYNVGKAAFNRDKEHYRKHKMPDGSTYNSLNNFNAFYEG